jgi:enoyl-[acyl-carrier protein] reductase II
MSWQTISTRLTSIYGVEYPFAAAGMAFVGTAPNLAAAVCRAGGIGSIAVGPVPAEAVRALVRAVRAETDRPLNINFITFLTRDDQIQVCIEEQVPIVSFHWGHPPRTFLDILHEAGIKVWEQVGSVADAKRAVDDGIDLIVAQGSEAGGHNYSTLPTFVLVPAIVDTVTPTLVLAAGGITNGRQVAAALALGADGVWVGTRLVASVEAFAHDSYKRRLVEADGTETCLTSIFGPEMAHFNPMRVIENRVVREFSGHEDLIPKSTESEPVIGKTSLLGQEMTLRRFSNFVPMPTTEGDLEEMPLLAGQGIGLIRDIKPAGEIVHEMMTEAAAVLSRYTRSE